jgi:hypothetical protein
VKQRWEPPGEAFREAAPGTDHPGMTADYLRRRFPVTCGTGLADRLTAACGNQMLRFLRYPD